MGGAFGSEVAVMMTGGGKNLANSPYNITVITGALGQLGIFVVAAFMGVPIYRDFEHKTFPLFFTKPISKWHYLGGRFFGSLLISALVLLGISLGLILSQWLPAVNADSYGAFDLWYYLHPYFLVTLPFAVFTGAIFFATVSLTRNQLFIYLNAIVVLLLTFAASYLSSKIDNKTLSSLIDPTGLTAITKTTELWTVTERNQQLIPLNWLIVVNRVLWLSVGIAILLFTYARFSFTFVGKGRAKQAPSKAAKKPFDTLTIQKIRLPKVAQDFSQAYQGRLLRILAKKEFFQVLYNPIFLIITFVGMLFMVLSISTSGQILETPVLPVTYRILDILSGSFRMFILAIIVFYSGEMVWAERQHKVNLMYDALPIPNWLPFTSKFLAMIGIEVFLLTVIMLLGMLVQAGNSYYNFEPLLYIQHLYGVQMLDLLLFTTLTFTIHIIVNNKYLGFFVVVLTYFFFGTVLPYLGVTHKLFLFRAAPPMLYSDLNGYGHFLTGWLAFKTYWLAFGVMLLVFANGLWLRGTDSHFGVRWRKTIRSFAPVAKLTLAVATVVFVALGVYIFYNTNILNDFVTQEEENELRANYEKKYKKYEHIPQPKIIDVRLNVDLYPYERKVKAKGHYLLKNKTKSAIKTIHINTLNNAVVHKMQLGQGFSEQLNDKALAYAIYKLNKPLEPTQTITLDFELSYEYKGFGNSPSNNFLTYNGTFLNNQVFPSIGYQPLGELDADGVRKEYGLPPRQRFPLIDDKTALGKNALSNDADWINFEVTLSTAPDQIAVAPGYLQKEWKKGERRYFHYKMDKPILNFYSILSARYAVKKDVWTSKEGKKVNLEIYYHPTHSYNLERMMEGMKKSLSYCSANFSPYQYRQMRILEFPRYAGFAQSFANTVPYSESLGFLADVDDKKDVDFVLYVTAHEVGHQWWGHQVVPAYTQGAHTVIESMAQYSALMTMEKALGKDKIKKFLRLEMNKYLKGRSAEINKERPLMLTEGQQYIHYNKGSVILYALQDYIGEKQMNVALKKYIKQVAYKDAPYTTAREWVNVLREATPDSLQYLITDMFEKITLYENKAHAVSYEKKGDKYEVTLEIAAKKMQSDGYGVEKEVALNDYIDIGIFARVPRADKQKGKENKVLYLKKHKLSQGKQTIKILVDTKPHSAGIDPYNKLIDRKPDDNTLLFTKNGKPKPTKN
jgi:ABC-type transport system involved in multi-copper enzyme maturation permease subunit